MKKLIVAATLAVLASSPCAQTTGMKAGLWEMKTLKQVMDGKDMQAQMAAAQAQMQKALANMPPEQRKQMEATMAKQGAAMLGGGAMRLCISPEMAARDKPMVDPDGKCEPAKVSRSGNKTSYEFNCQTDGRSMVGKGDSTYAGDTITSRMDMTTTDARGKHTMQTESQMKYLGADCGTLKPAGQVTRK
jgi:hypothetical protein